MAQLNSPLVSDYYYDEQVEEFSDIKAECGSVAEEYTFTKSVYGVLPEMSTSKPVPTAAGSTASGVGAEVTAPPGTCGQRDAGVGSGACDGGGNLPGESGGVRDRVVMFEGFVVVWGVAMWSYVF